MKMDWEEIKEKYPKGSKLKDEWIEKNKIFPHTHSGGYIEIEDYMQCVLKYFFDEQGIYIIIDKMVNWGWAINDDDNPDEATKFNESSTFEYKSRKEAEEQAFMKAFEILEEQSTE